MEVLQASVIADMVDPAHATSSPGPGLPAALKLAQSGETRCVSLVQLIFDQEGYL
jgi:hypothetical protein